MDPNMLFQEPLIVRAFIDETRVEMIMLPHRGHEAIAFLKEKMAPFSRNQTPQFRLLLQNGDEIVNINQLLIAHYRACEQGVTFVDIFAHSLPQSLEKEEKPSELQKSEVTAAAKSSTSADEIALLKEQIKALELEQVSFRNLLDDVCKTEIPSVSVKILRMENDIEFMKGKMIAKMRKEKKHDKSFSSHRSCNRSHPGDKSLYAHNASCDVCNESIVGTRFKCTICPDFDLCSKCEADRHHDCHAMLRIVNSSTLIPVELERMKSASRVQPLRTTFDFGDIRKLLDPTVKAARDARYKQCHDEIFRQVQAGQLFDPLLPFPLPQLVHPFPSSTHFPPSVASFLAAEQEHQRVMKNFREEVEKVNAKFFQLPMDKSKDVMTEKSVAKEEVESVEKQIKPADAQESVFVGEHNGDNEDKDDENEDDPDIEIISFKKHSGSTPEPFFNVPSGRLVPNLEADKTISDLLDMGIHYREIIKVINKVGPNKEKCLMALFE